jgi:PKD domain
MLHRLTALVYCTAALAFTGTALMQAQSDDKQREPKRPSLSLKATPGTGMVPVRVSATAEFKGGDDDFRDYYCPAVEWNWGDGTVSETSNDCDPYEAGVSLIRRRFTQSHTYKRAGAYRITFRLKSRDKVLTSQTTVVRMLGGGF